MRRHHCTGFTLLELLVVMAVIAIATAGISLALRDTSQTALEREAQRLAVLFESARAKSRASGTAVIWRSTPDGFRFDGLPANALPEHWILNGIVIRGTSAVRLGPEPIIGAQAVELMVSSLPGELKTADGNSSDVRAIRISTDGLRPFAVTE